MHAHPIPPLPIALHLAANLKCSREKGLGPCSYHESWCLGRNVCCCFFTGWNALKLQDYFLVVSYLLIAIFYKSVCAYQWHQKIHVYHLCSYIYLSIAMEHILKYLHPDTPGCKKEATSQVFLWNEILGTPFMISLLG